MTSLSEKINKEIKDKILKPKPLWQFKLMESGRWLSVAGLIIVVGFVASMLWLFVSGLDIGLTGWLSGRPFLSGRVLLFIFVALVIGAIAIFLDIRKTKHGYKYKTLIVIILISVIGLIFASIFAWSGLPGRFDKALSGAPLYQTREQYMISVWQQPSEGRLTGEIISINNKTDFVLRDFNNKEWQIVAPQAIWRHNLESKIGLKIKMLGKLNSESGFEANDIRPFLPENGSCGQEVFSNNGGCRMRN